MALTYKKLSELTDMTSANIDTTTKLVVTTGSTKVNNNLKVTDLIVDDLVTNNQYRALSAKQGKKLQDEKAPIANPTFTGTVSGITKSMVGLANVDNTIDANKPVSTATQTQLNLKANLASPTFTGTVTLPSTTPTPNTYQAATTKYVDSIRLTDELTIDYWQENQPSDTTIGKYWFNPTGNVLKKYFNPILGWYSELSYLNANTIYIFNGDRHIWNGTEMIVLSKVSDKAPATNPSGGANNYAPKENPTFTGTVALPAANTLGTSTTKPATEAAVRSVLQSSNVRIIDVYDGDGYDLNSLDGTVFVNLTAGQDSLVRLPSGAGAGIKLTIKVVGVATVGLSSNTDSAETIDGVNVIATPIELAQNDSITVVGDGSNWYAIGTY